MEILTTSAHVYADSFSDRQTAVDIKQIVAGNGAYPSQANPPPDSAAQASPGQELSRKDRAGRKKKQPGLDGEAGALAPGVMPLPEPAAMGGNRIASRLENRHGAGQDIRGALADMEGRRRLKAAAAGETSLPPAAKDAVPSGDVLLPAAANAAEPRLADLPDTRSVGAGEGDDNSFNGLMSAGVPVNARPAGESAPAQLKTPEPLLNERHNTAQFAPETKSHDGDRGGTLLYTFNNGKALGTGATEVNQVKIAFQGSTILAPSNRTVEENLLANQSEARGYLVQPASEREQQRRQQHDQDAGEDQ
ncbi:hypothetical protein GTU79_25450 [Sodalis ligni]|uniref:hypothetical protein n=1 Tax=Sodalis ligni TaxID=2697027 RepID=UPI00193F6FF7|nr:hypothetical protein [Sodalis ligni]QWA10509.1 hypothetical protein GTU79_25450 [Sodalis ligni]